MNQFMTFNFKKLWKSLMSIWAVQYLLSRKEKNASLPFHDYSDKRSHFIWIVPYRLSSDAQITNTLSIECLLTTVRVSCWVCLMWCSVNKKKRLNLNFNKLSVKSVGNYPHKVLPKKILSTFSNQTFSKEWKQGFNATSPLNLSRD